MELDMVADKEVDKVADVVAGLLSFAILLEIVCWSVKELSGQ